MNKKNLLSILICGLIFTMWVSAATWSISFSVLIFSMGLCFCSWIGGMLVAHWIPFFSRMTLDFNQCFLLGYFLINTLTATIYMLLPLSILVSLGAILIILVMLFIALLVRGHFLSGTGNQHQAGIAALLIIFIACTFWVQSCLFPIEQSNGFHIFKPWSDSFWHARWISMLGQSKGYLVEGFGLLVDQPAPLYHSASYIIPAGLHSWAKINAYASYCAWYVPVGLVLTGLAAYSLARYLWGSWAGCAASVMVMLVPDAAHSGIRNYYLSYYWLQGISPALMYGVALMAIAWMLMLDGCRSGRRVMICLSFGIAAISLIYKIHIFVANAFVIWIFPALFMQKVSRIIRACWLCGAIAVYIMVLKVMQAIPYMPLIRYDGSAASDYTRMLISQFENALLQSMFSYRIHSGITMLDNVSWVIWMGVMLFIGTFGVLGVIMFVAMWRAKQRSCSDEIVFTLLVIGNYLIMSLGLAYETRLQLTLDEFVHRQFVWAYFIVAVWTAGFISVDMDRVARSRRIVRAVLAVLIVGLLCVPIVQGGSIQVGPPKLKKYSRIPVPDGMLNACAFIRVHSRQGDVVQDMEGDPYMIVTGLTEHPAYVIDKIGVGSAGLLNRRLLDLDEFRKMRRIEDIQIFLRESRVQWLIVHPGKWYEWPDAMKLSIVFASDGYRVIQVEQTHHKIL